jgi:hypothetical protein
MMDEVVWCAECGCSVPSSPLLHVRTELLPDGDELLELFCPSCAVELEEAA